MGLFRYCQGLLSHILPYNRTLGMSYSRSPKSDDLRKLFLKQSGDNLDPKNNIYPLYSKNKKIQRQLNLYKRCIEEELMYDKTVSSIKISEVIIRRNGQHIIAKWQGVGDKVIDEQINYYLSSFSHSIRKRIQVEERNYNVPRVVFSCDTIPIETKEMDNIFEEINPLSENLELKANLPDDVYDLPRDQLINKIKVNKKKNRMNYSDEVDLENHASINLKKWYPRLSQQKQFIKSRKQKEGLSPENVFNDSDYNQN